MWEEECSNTLVCKLNINILKELHSTTLIKPTPVDKILLTDLEVLLVEPNGHCFIYLIFTAQVIWPEYFCLLIISLGFLWI